MIDPRAVAVGGVGFAAITLATLGLIVSAADAQIVDDSKIAIVASCARVALVDSAPDLSVVVAGSRHALIACSVSVDRVATAARVTVVDDE